MKSPKRNVLAFQWDASESITADGYLTPVYFNKQVLTRYLYDSHFYCDFVSETYSNIGNEEFSMSFGVNRNGSVIAWLGDIMETLPQREQFYWLVKNKDPENEIASEFFDAQINADFTDPAVSVSCLNALARFNAVFHKSFNVYLYHERSIDERIDDTRRYRRLILNNIDDFKRFISEFNEIINENTNNAGIRRFLTERRIDFQNGAKGNKLLEKIYCEILHDTMNIIAPFFYLYDLRLWADHSMSDEKRDVIAASLGVTSADNYQSLMTALLRAIQNSSEQLEAKIRASQNGPSSGSEEPHQRRDQGGLTEQQRHQPLDDVGLDGLDLGA